MHISKKEPCFIDGRALIISKRMRLISEKQESLGYAHRCRTWLTTVAPVPPIFCTRANSGSGT